MSCKNRMFGLFKHGIEPKVEVDEIKVSGVEKSLRRLAAEFSIAILNIESEFRLGI